MAAKIEVPKIESEGPERGGALGCSNQQAPSPPATGESCDGFYWLCNIVNCGLSGSHWGQDPLGHPWVRPCDAVMTLRDSNEFFLSKPHESEPVAKAGMAHAGWGRTCGCARKTVISLENTCHTWALLSGVARLWGVQQ